MLVSASVSKHPIFSIHETAAQGTMQLQILRISIKQKRMHTHKKEKHSSEHHSACPNTFRQGWCLLAATVGMVNRLQTSAFQNNRNSSHGGVRTFGEGCGEQIPRSKEGLYMPVHCKKRSSVHKPNFCSQTTPPHSQFFTIFNSGSLCNLWANKQLMQRFLNCYLN